MFSNNKILVALREGEHKALYVTQDSKPRLHWQLEVLKIFEAWDGNEILLT